MKNYADEIKWLQKRLDDNPNTILFARLAERYLKKEEIDRAIQICERGLEFHPDYSTGYFVLAKCFLQKKEFELAEKQLKKILSMDPNYLLAQKIYGDLMTELGWEQSAESSYKKILEIDPLETNVRLMGLDNQINFEKDVKPEISSPKIESDLEINEDSIENLFKSDLDTQESDESIESLFAGTVDEDISDTFGLNEQEKATERGLSDETVEALFEPESDTSFESIVDEQSRSQETIEELREEPEDSLTEPKAKDEESDLGRSLESTIETDTESFSADDTDESVFGFAGEDKAAAKHDETMEEEVQIDESAEKAEALDLSGTTDSIEEDMENLNKVGKEALLEKDSETDFSTDKNQETEDRYSNILDGIFSPGLDEEERKEMDTRSKLEQDVEQPGMVLEEKETVQDIFSIDEEEMEQVSEETVSPLEGESDEENLQSLSPEDTIINKADDAEKITAQPEDVLKEEPKEEPEIPEGFMAFEEDDSEGVETGTVHLQDFDSENIDEEEEELGQFLAGLGEPEEEKESLPDQDIYSDILDETPAQTGKPTISTEVEEEKEETPAKPEEQVEAVKPEKPNGEPEPEQVATPKDKFVTPTLGEIYAAQGQYTKAINVFELLLEKQPNNEYYKTKLDYLKKKLDEGNN